MTKSIITFVTYVVANLLWLSPESCDMTKLIRYIAGEIGNEHSSWSHCPQLHSIQVARTTLFLHIFICGKTYTTFEVEGILPTVLLRPFLNMELDLYVYHEQHNQTNDHQQEWKAILQTGLQLPSPLFPSFLAATIAPSIASLLQHICLEGQLGGRHGFLGEHNTLTSFMQMDQPDNRGEFQ